MRSLNVTLRDEGLLLDLLNTTPVVDGKQRDVLADRESAHAWLRAHALAENELNELIAVRNVLQAVVRGTASADALTPYLSAAAMRAHATDNGVEWELAVDDAMRGALRTILAWGALRAARPGRLRACANPDCRLFLIDRSKPNTARWCSMTTCGNRMKARRYHRRVRAAKATNSPDHTGG